MEIITKARSEKVRDLLYAILWVGKIFLRVLLKKKSLGYAYKRRRGVLRWSCFPLGDVTSLLEFAPVNLKKETKSQLIIPQHIFHLYGPISSFFPTDIETLFNISVVGNGQIMISAGVMREEQKKPQPQDMCAHFTTSWYDVRLLFPSTPRKQLHHHPLTSV